MYLFLYLQAHSLGAALSLMSSIDLFILRFPHPSTAPRRDLTGCHAKSFHKAPAHNAIRDFARDFLGMRCSIPISSNNPQVSKSDFILWWHSDDFPWTSWTYT